MITIIGKSIQKLIAEPDIPAKTIKKKSTHIIAEPYSGSGDFTIANLMYHLELSHSAVHARMMPSRKRRRIPPPDGAAPWTWQPATAYEYLRKYQPKHLRESRGNDSPA